LKISQAQKIDRAHNPAEAGSLVQIQLPQPKFLKLKAGSRCPAFFFFGLTKKYKKQLIMMAGGRIRNPTLAAQEWGTRLTSRHETASYPCHAAQSARVRLAHRSAAPQARNRAASRAAGRRIVIMRANGPSLC
jgi:hypothetical protein